MSRGLIVAILFLGAVAIAGIVGGTWLVLSFYDIPAAARQLPAAEKRARELGMPLVAADIRPNPPVKADENAAPELRAMCATIASSTWKSVGDAEKELHAGRPAIAETLVREAAPAIAFAEKAARKPKVDMGRDWDLGTFVLFPEYAKYKQVAKLLCMDAELRAKRGDARGSLNDLSIAHALGRFAGQEPNVIGCLVAIALDRIRDRTVERIAALWAKDGPKLVLLEERLKRDSDMPSLAHALCGEEFLLVATLRNLSSSNVAPKHPLREGMPSNTTAQAYMTRHLQCWARIWPALTRVPEDPLEIERVHRPVATFVMAQHGMSYVLLKWLFPTYGNAADAHVTLSAHNAAAIAMIDVLRYRNRTGAWPTNLVDACAITRDPFTGKSLLYRVNGSAFRVYSVGRDRKDDGGKDRSELPAGRKDDPSDEAAIYPPLTK